MIALLLGLAPTPAEAATGTITEFTLPPTNNFSVGSSPEGITAGPDGNLWFAEYGSNQIGRITPAGVITEFRLPRKILVRPWGIAAGPGRTLWFTETFGDPSRIGRITLKGSITELVLPVDDLIEGIARGPDGNMWFAEYHGVGIGRITPAGVFAEFAIGVGSGKTPLPRGITAGRDGNLWFTDFGGSNKIGRITPSGTVTEFSMPSPGSHGLLGITAGPDGNVWFTEVYKNRIGRITPRGAVTEFPLPTPNSYPVSITAGPDGNLWFTGSNQIGRITPRGTITEFASPGGGNEITAGPDGNIWFTELRGKIGRLQLSKRHHRKPNSSPLPQLGLLAAKVSGRQRRPSTSTGRNRCRGAGRRPKVSFARGDRRGPYPADE